MRWLTTEARTKDAKSWHKWFAWHPVCIGDQWVWLEPVERIIYEEDSTTLWHTHRSYRNCIYHL